MAALIEGINYDVLLGDKAYDAVYEIPRGRIDKNFVGKALWCCTCEWSYAFSGQNGSQTAYGGAAFIGGERLKFAGAQIGR
ncbi:hypothetical protein ACOBR2_15665 [Telmatobacter bradus]|uniref:hypothetical protein n=1 Tax=Telmatobacter bradus TaxID=474953 RepID=UPI003B42BA87